LNVIMRNIISDFDLLIEQKEATIQCSVFQSLNAGKLSKSIQSVVKSNRKKPYPAIYLSDVKRVHC
jgi:hypothetical protein